MLVFPKNAEKNASTIEKGLGGGEGSQEYGVLGRGGGCSGEAVEPMKNNLE